MEQTTHPAPLLAGTRFAFTPVAQQRHRADGWTPDTQANFIRALSAMGSVGKAERAVGMGRASAYRLRERSHAASFAAAWDSAISTGRMHQFSVAMMDRAIDVSSGPDMAVVHAALREDALAKTTKETI